MLGRPPIAIKIIGTASNKVSKLANERIAMPFDGGIESLVDLLVDS